MYGFPGQNTTYIPEEDQIKFGEGLPSWPSDCELAALNTCNSKLCWHIWQLLMIRVLLFTIKVSWTPGSCLGAARPRGLCSGLS